nr:GGDEF domain-containing protein [Simiduia aestuariiviva]
MQSLILEALVKEQQLARTDGLTGAINNRQFYALLEDELARHHRFDQTLSLGYLDVDDFKAVNELGGHNLGDRLLKEIVVTSQKTLRRVDTIARLGGDEFAVILPQTDKAAALKALTNLQSALNKRLKQFPGSASVSIGAVSCHKPELPVGALIKYADELMYRVKRSGKNGLLCEHIEPPNTVIEPRP